MDTVTYDSMNLKKFKEIVNDFLRYKQPYLKIIVTKNLQSQEKYYNMIYNTNIALSIPNANDEIKTHSQNVEKWCKRDAIVKQTLNKPQGVKKTRPERRTKALSENSVHKDIGNYHTEHLMYLLERRCEDWIRHTDWPEYDDGLFGFIPKFQRNSVWSIKQKQDLIKSRLNQIPIGAFYVNELPSEFYGDSEKAEELDIILYDGQQRFLAIKDFLEGDYPLEIDGETFYVGDLNISDVIKIKTTLVPIYVTAISNLDDLIDYYEMINTGGTLHSQAEILKARNYKTKK